MKKPIFILGCPRSGTTMLASLLNNSSYGEPVETHFITKYYKKLNNYGRLDNKENFKRLINDILKERAVMQWKLQLDPDKFFDEINELNFKEIVNKLCMERSHKKGYASWGDKTPHYLRNCDILFKLFPDSKYIYIVRDGRDVALSLMEKPWGPNNVLTCAELWKRYNVTSEIIEELKKRKQLYFVRYEDLLDNAEQIVPEVYNFLDEKNDESEMSKLIGRIKKGNYNKWKTKMNARQIKIFENTAANTLKRFGYEATYEESELNGFTRAMYNGHESIMRGIFLFKTNVIDGIGIRFFGKEPFAE